MAVQAGIALEKIAHMSAKMTETVGGRKEVQGKSDWATDDDFARRYHTADCPCDLLGEGEVLAWGVWHGSYAGARR
jgi:hypothetical protein